VPSWWWWDCHICGGDGYWDCFSIWIRGWKVVQTIDCKGYIACRRCGGDGIVAANVIDETGISGLTYVDEAINIWRRGRYYRQNDAEFISQQIDLARLVSRVVVEPNPMLDPYGGQRWKSSEGVTADEATAWLAQSWYYPGVKILGLTWTGYTDGIQDYRDVDPVLLSPQLEVSLEAKDKDGGWTQVAGPFLNTDSGWAPVMVKIPSGKIRYRVRFNTRCDPLNTILLETPILDDVTIYWVTRPQWVSWVESY
jgi:hypothetical protein